MRKGQMIKKYVILKKKKKKSKLTSKCTYKHKKDY